VQMHEIDIQLNRHLIASQCRTHGSRQAMMQLILTQPAPDRLLHLFIAGCRVAYCHGNLPGYGVLDQFEIAWDLWHQTDQPNILTRKKLAVFFLIGRADMVD
jgi:hypothetical protein